MCSWSFWWKVGFTTNLFKFTCGELITCLSDSIVRELLYKNWISLQNSEAEVLFTQPVQPGPEPVDCTSYQQLF